MVFISLTFGLLFWGRVTYRLYESSMHDKIISRLALEQDLWKAIKNKEFQMYYQPKVNLQTEKIEGLEALIRWHRPRWETYFSCGIHPHCRAEPTYS